MTVRITTPKLLDLTPTWAPFTGWTVLFDNPGPRSGTVPEGHLDRLEVEDFTGRLALYGRLARVQRAVDDRLGDAPVAFLPPASFHVTVMDGLSVPHVELLGDRQGSRLAEVLDRIPDVADAFDTVTPDGVELTGLLDAVGASPIELELDAVRCRGHAILADLKPSRTARAAFGRIERVRRSTLGALGDAVGFDLVTPWTPHVTLGYVANREAAGELRHTIERAAAGVETAPADERLAFTAAGPYVYTSMTTYYRARSRGWLRRTGSSAGRLLQRRGTS